MKKTETTVTPVTTGAGLGDIAILATVTLALLRAGGVIDWRWPCILAPLLAYGFIMLASWGIALIMAATRIIRGRRNGDRNSADDQ